MAVTDYGHDARMNGALVKCRTTPLTGQTAVSVYFPMTTFLSIDVKARPTAGTVPTELFYAVQDTTNANIIKVWSSDNASTTTVYVTATGY
jgi:hypothetical protein